jgi:hypothetical protein
VAGVEAGGPVAERNDPWLGWLGADLDVVAEARDEQALKAALLRVALRCRGGMEAEARRVDVADQRDELPRPWADPTCDDAVSVGQAPPDLLPFGHGAQAIYMG